MSKNRHFFQHLYRARGGEGAELPRATGSRPNLGDMSFFLLFFFKIRVAAAASRLERRFEKMVEMVAMVSQVYCLVDLRLLHLGNFEKKSKNSKQKRKKNNNIMKLRIDLLPQFEILIKIVIH